VIDIFITHFCKHVQHPYVGLLIFAVKSVGNKKKSCDQLINNNARVFTIQVRVQLPTSADNATLLAFAAVPCNGTDKRTDIQTDGHRTVT